MQPLILILTVAVVLVLMYRYIIYPALLSPLSKIPNAHFSVPFTSTWIDSKRPGGATGIAAILAAHEKHGPIIRLSPDELSVTSLDGLRKIYTGAFEKDLWFEDAFVNYGTPNMVSMLENKPHAAQKRMLSHVYSKSYIQSSSDLRALSKVLIFERILPLFQHSSENKILFDAYGFSCAVGMDFVTAFLFGIDNSTNFIDNPSTRKKFMDNLTAKRKGVKKGTDELEAYVFAMYRSAVQSPGQSISQPVVVNQLSTQLLKSPLSPQLKELLIASEVFDHIIASVETTTTTLIYLQWELSRNPQLQAALREELRALSPSFQFNSYLEAEEQQLPDPKHLDALPLLNAIIKETLRVYPPTPALLSRVVPLGGSIIEGYTIPGGTVVGTSAKCMHLNEEVFLDASSFKPDRWLSDKSEEGENRLREMNRWFWVFGSGGRMCIGNHFALHSKCPFLLQLFNVYGNMYQSAKDSLADGLKQC